MLSEAQHGRARLDELAQRMTALGRLRGGALRGYGLGDIAPTGSALPKTYSLTSTAAGAAAMLPAAAVGGTLFTIAGVALTVPVIGGIIAGVATLMAVLHVGEGCGEPCIDAAKGEQLFEAAADNIYAIAKAGMLPSSSAVAAMQWILTQAQQSMASIGTKQAQDGLAHATKVITAEIAAAQDLPDRQSAPLDPKKIQVLYLTPPMHGWYDDALASAEVLAGNAIAQLPAVSAVMSAGSPGTSSLAQEAQAVAQEATSNPLLTIGLLAAAGLALKMVM